jgi:holo-[acyl-carrier protein] synthase
MSSEVFIGIDLVNIPRVKRILSHCGEMFINRIAVAEEIDYYRHRSDRRLLEGVATLFAMKEAIKKIFLQKQINPGWKQFQIYHDASGKPWVAFSEASLIPVFQKISLSISHTHEFVVAVAVGLSQ